MFTQYIKIPQVNDKSSKMNDSFLERGYFYEVEKKGQFKTYHIGYADDGGCLLVSNIDKHQCIPGNTTYAFVIVQMAGQFILKIRNTGHYYISDKATHVYAAGDIEFEDGMIVSITDHSGTYHYNANMNVEYHEYLHSVISVMKTVGLPVNRFKPYRADLERDPVDVAVDEMSPRCSEMFGFFTPKNVGIASVAALALTGGIYILQTL